MSAAMDELTRIAGEIETSFEEIGRIRDRLCAHVFELACVRRDLAAVAPLAPTGEDTVIRANFGTPLTPNEMKMLDAQDEAMGIAPENRCSALHARAAIDGQPTAEIAYHCPWRRVCGCSKQGERDCRGRTELGLNRPAGESGTPIPIRRHIPDQPA